MRAFQKVILPLTRPGIVAGVLLVFIPAIGRFAVAFWFASRRQGAVEM